MANGGESRRLHHKLVYRGRVLTLEVDRVIEPSGLEVEREVVRHAGAAVVVALTEEQKAKQREIIESHLVAADMVITTALVPGRTAPILITGEVVQRMKPGAVIVDLAVSQGGNCELSEPGRVLKHDVTIIGELNIPALLPTDASAMFARNLFAIVGDIVDRESGGKITLDINDEVVAGSLIIEAGKIRHAPTRQAVERLGGAS